MSTTEPRLESSEVEAAIHRVALSLDAFLVNGLQYGALGRVTADGLLTKAAASLLTDLASLAEQVRQAAPDQAPVAEGLAGLRAQCQHLVELVTGLKSFRTLPLEQVRGAAQRIVALRDTCAAHIRQLEISLRVPRSYSSSRPAIAAAAVERFLAGLEETFTREWADSRSDADRP